MKPINITGDGLPASEADFETIFNRLEDYYGEDSIFYLDDDELDELYYNMISGLDLDIEVGGQALNDFNDFVELEKNIRTDEINGLLGKVESFEAAVEDNEEFFEE